MNKKQIEHLRKQMNRIETRLHNIKLDFQLLIRDLDRFNKEG